MTNTEQIKAKYYRQVREVLFDHPEPLKKFDELWQAGKLREAYLAFEDSTKNLKIALSPQQRKTDEDFYWDIVN